ncbi:hypothetical protein COBT_001051 [Conglomerata obtusa]
MENENVLKVIEYKIKQLEHNPNKKSIALIQKLIDTIKNAENDERILLLQNKLNRYKINKEIDNDNFKLNNNRLIQAKEVNEKVDEIVALTDYVNILVTNQGRTIDNVMYKMRSDVNVNQNMVENLRSTLRKKKRRKYQKIFVYCALFFICFVVMKYAASFIL